MEGESGEQVGGELESVTSSAFVHGIVVLRTSQQHLTAVSTHFFFSGCKGL